MHSVGKDPSPLETHDTYAYPTLRWSNDTAEPILFPREMCLAYGLYFPDEGEIFCDPD